MAIVTTNNLNQPVISPENLVHQRLAAERMQDVRLLLQNLSNSEEAGFYYKTYLIVKKRLLS